MMDSYKQFIILFLLIDVRVLRSVLTDVGMRLDYQQFSFVLTTELKTLVAMFQKYGFEGRIRMVGGAVRDILNGQKPVDVDLVTSISPQEMREMFKAEDVPMFNDKLEGGKHSSITARINHKENFEISTLQKKLWTDTRIDPLLLTSQDDWLLDAARRDFTVNGIYLDFEGNLYDYFKGSEDLKNHRVAFIGDARKRSKGEPDLILRYFRIFGKVTDNPRNHDEKILQALRDHLAGLDSIPGARMWTELRGVFCGNFANEIVKTMLNLGMARYTGLGYPNDLDISCFDFVCRNSLKYSFEPMTLVASLLRTREQVSTFSKRMKLSHFHRSLGNFIVRYKNYSLPNSVEECFKFFQRELVLKSTSNGDRMRTYIVELLKVLDREAVINLFSKWTMPIFPIDGKVLKEKDIEGQHQIGLFVTILKEKWMDNGFVLNDTLITDVANQLTDHENKI